MTRLKKITEISLDIIQRIKSGELLHINFVLDLDHTLVHGIKSEFVKDSLDLKLLSDIQKKNQVYEMFVDNDEVTRELHNSKGFNISFETTQWRAYTI